MFCRLPDGLFTLSSLTHLVLNETFLECLPENMGKLVVLFSFLFLFKLRLIFFTHAYAVAAQTSFLNLEVPQYFTFLSISNHDDRFSAVFFRAGICHVFFFTTLIN